jgi:hypothetical protein
MKGGKDGSYGVYGRINGTSYTGGSGDIFSSKTFALPPAIVHNAGYINRGSVFRYC